MTILPNNRMHLFFLNVAKLTVQYNVKLFKHLNMIQISHVLHLRSMLFQIVYEV